MHVLKEMARLIVENPTMSARELAAKMGYSQEKSIYYWLGKAGFKGIKDFKKRVLKGEYVPGPPPAVPRRSAPARTRETAAGEHLVLPSPPYRIERPLGEGAFAHALETDEYSPLAVKGDVLIVDPSRTPADGQLVLTDRDTVARYYVTGTGIILAHPARGQAMPLDQEQASQQIVGPVVYILRPLP